MFRKIAASMSLADWVRAPDGDTPGSRWWRLEVYDRLLDGRFYDHLPYGFYDEVRPGTQEMIPLEKRRPSTQLRLPRYLARWASRKLFAGRHIPKIRAKDTATEARVRDLLTGTKIWSTMAEAAYRGSVGSVAVTFRAKVGDGPARVGMKVWRAAWCSPQFDDFGELTQLRVHYITSAADLAAIGIQVEDPQRQYWFIRDFTSESEITYIPPLDSDWNPAGKGVEELGVAKVVDHGLGFVPGVWIANPGGPGGIDGAALFEDAIPNTIEIDYLLSQASRGARYNCSPQLVTRGKILNLAAGGLQRGPMTYLAFESARKDQASGEMLGAGGAELLEMNGKGTEVALKIVEVLKKYALEMAGVIQKDPGEMPGPLSGRAMEYLDEDAHDTAMQWRSTYGEGGALPLVCKILHVLDPGLDTSGLWLQWPRIYQPTPADLQSMVQALAMAATPTPVPGGVAGEDGAVPTLEPLLDRHLASQYLVANLDLGILDDTIGEAAAGPEGGEPEAADKDETAGGGAGMFGPYWRILPPVKVRGA